jgi:hypothetical protein
VRFRVAASVDIGNVPGVLYLAIASAVALVIGIAYVVLRERARAKTPIARATRYREELVGLVKDEDTADRLAEGELARDPGIDMPTAYKRALDRLRYERSR